METQQDHKRFCCLVLALVGSGAAAIALANFFVNPYAQYAFQPIDPLVQQSRSEKVALLAAAEPRPDALILGSSRVMKLEPAQLQNRSGHTFFNAGMNYARIEDFLAFLRYYESRLGKSPKMVVLGIDVAGFSEAPVDARLLSQRELGWRVPEAAGLAGRYRRWQELLSWKQSVDSLKSLKHAILADPVDSPTESFRPDGLRVYHEREEAIANGTYDFNASLEYNQREYMHLMAGYRRLSPLRLELFRELIRHCEQRGIELAVFLTPLHPDLANYLFDTTTYVARRSELIQFLELETAQTHCSFVDLSEIEKFAGDAAQFVDGIHPLEANTRKMIGRIWDSVQEQTRYVVQ